MNFLDADDPFFKPVWRRWATTVVPLLMAGFEMYGGSPLWATMFFGLAAYAGFILLIKGPSSGSE